MVEKKILSLCLQDPKNLLACIQRGLKPDHFTLPEVQTLYKVLIWFYNNYKVIPTHDGLITTVGQSTLSPELKGSLPVLYIELKGSTVLEPIDFLFDSVIKEYKEKELRKALAGVVDDLQGKRIEETIKKVKRKLVELELLDVSNSHEGDLRESTDERLELYNNIKNNPRMGVHTGIPTVDHVTGGIQKGELWVVLGFLKSGKSTVLVNLAYNAWLQGKNVLFVSAEVAKRVLERRIDALHTDLSYTSLKRGSLSAEEEILYSQKIAALKNHPSLFYILDKPGISTSAIQAKVQELKNICTLDLVVVDYIGLLQPQNKGDGMFETYGNVALELRHIARTEEVPVLTAHQINREGGNSSKVKITQIAHSLDIARHADLALSIRVKDDDEKQFSPICTLESSILISRDSATVKFELEAVFDKMKITELLKMN